MAHCRYPGKISLLVETYLVFAKGGNLLGGWDMGYKPPSNELMIIKHGSWNATEATGHPGEAKIIENDQGYIDCEHTQIEQTADEITVSYRLKFKPGGLRGMCNVYMYIADKDVKYEGFTQMGAVAIDTDAEVTRTDMPAQWRNALQPPGTASAPLTLATDGHARYNVLLPPQPSVIEAKAASELCQALRLITGADFATVNEGDAVTGLFISVGRTRKLAGSAAKWKGADLAAEGYGLEVVGPDLYLYGGSGRGLLNAVYALLEEDLGCRWYDTGSVDVQRRPALTAAIVSRKVVPALQLRDPYILSMHDPNWSLHNRTNTPHARIPQAWGGSLRYFHMGHTYAAYFPSGSYFKEHPEYYSLVNGKRQPSQLCQTNEDVIRLSIEKTCQIFRDHPDVTITAIGPNDGRGFCDCPNCRKLNDENGGRSGSYFYFLNRIAAGVKKEFPNNHIISLAYLDYAPPPTKFEVDPYIIIQLCTDSHAWKYQFCRLDESQDFQKIIKAWEPRHNLIYVWDYTTDYVHYPVPMANWQVVAANTRFLVQHGVDGIMYESEANDCDEMRAWVWAQQLWNPSLDPKALMRDFIYGYYKQAAGPIWDYEQMVLDYWENWHKLPHQCGKPSDNPLLNNLQCSYSPDGPMFTPEFMAKMRQCFEAAEKLATDKDVAARVRRAELPLLYLELCQNLGYYTEFGDFVYGRSIRQTPAAKEAFRPKLDEFVALCKERGLTTLGIPASVEKLTARWRQAMAAESVSLNKMMFPSEWVFAVDPDDRGMRDKCYADAKTFDAVARRNAGASAASLGKNLTVLHTNRGVGWEQQGFPGFDGPGWYFQTIRIPDDLAAKAHLYLVFLGINEEAWVYVNGQLAGEHTYASTGRGVGELGGAFSIDAKQWLKPGVDNTLAVRVMHKAGLGGMWLPSLLVGTDKPCTTEELQQYRY
ncbi:MAG: DUF4838 domain-containing protein [Armatimonadia bacterium]